MEKEKKDNQPKKTEDWLIIKLEKPLASAQGQIDRLDLTGVRKLTLDDMEELYDIYAMCGGRGNVMQEATMLFAKIIAQRVTGLTLEEVGKIWAKDAVKLKDRMWRFFYM